MTEQTTPTIGHNSQVGGIAADRLKSYVDRVEALEDEKAARAEDIKEVYVEIKSAGFDVKTVRTLIRLRKMDQAAREEQQALLDLYGRALGIWG